MLRHLIALARELAPALAALALMLVNGCTLHKPGRQIQPGDLAASCFDVTAEGGAVHLLFGQTADENKLDLYWSWRPTTSGDWSRPVRLPTSHAPAGNHQRGNDPQIAARGDHLMALWTARGGGPYGSGRIAVALSHDGGKTWSAGPSPVVSPRDDVGYRFPATAVDNTAFHLVWIHAEDKERSLRYARLEFGAQKWSAPRTIDATSCACCWNELKVGPEGKLFVLYRDEEPKDMALASSADAGLTWQAMGQVGVFNWQFHGCPHVGGGLDIAAKPQGGSALFATVWTGLPGHTGAYALTSGNEGRSWSALSKLAGLGQPGRHTDTAALSTQQAAVVFDVLTEEEQTVYLASTTDGGLTWSEPKRLSSPGTNARYPRVVAEDGRFLVFWSEYEEKSVPKLRMQVFSTSAGRDRAQLQETKQAQVGSATDDCWSSVRKT